MRPFASNLLRFRNARGWTRPELAKRSGVNARAIEVYERDESEPTLGVASALAGALNVTLDELAGRTPRTPEDDASRRRRGSDEAQWEAVRSIRRILDELEPLVAGDQLDPPERAVRG